jgi:NitT/TauT family transport system permease protein
VEQRSGGGDMTTRQRIIGITLRVVSLVVLLLVWEWYGSNPAHIATPPPSKVLPALWSAITSANLPSLTLGTLAEVGVGLVVSTIFGLVVGFAIALFPWAKDTIDPLIDALYAMPVTMLIPIVGVYIGLGFTGRVFVVFTYVALVIVISTATGVREVDRGLIDTARAYDVRGQAYFRKLLFPAAMTHIASGLSLGVSRAVRGAVTAEFLLVTVNLGAYIIRQQALFNNAALLGGIVWTLVLGYVLYGVALFVERRVTPWR